MEQGYNKRAGASQRTETKHGVVRDGAWGSLQAGTRERNGCNMIHIRVYHVTLQLLHDTVIRDLSGTRRVGEALLYQALFDLSVHGKPADTKQIGSLRFVAAAHVQCLFQGEFFLQKG